MKQDSVKVHLTISRPLLKEVDELADRIYSYRSDILRAALVEYIDAHRPLKEHLSDQMINKMRQKFPYVDADDLELLELLTYYEGKYGKEIN